jgi:hypothetical protein
MQIITSTVRDAGTRAERLALTPAAATAVFFWETDTEQAWFWDTANWVCLSISGAALVHDGVAGISHTIHQNALNATYARATNGFNFSGVGGAREVFVTILPTAAFTNEKKAILTYGAPNEGTASAWLSDIGGQSADVIQIPLQLGARNGPFPFDANVDWFDIATDVAGIGIIEGVTP